jgi:hypothetical protein
MNLAAARLCDPGSGEYTGAGPASAAFILALARGGALLLEHTGRPGEAFPSGEASPFQR